MSQTKEQEERIRFVSIADITEKSWVLTAFDTKNSSLASLNLGLAVDPEDRCEMFKCGIGPAPLPDTDAVVCYLYGGAGDIGLMRTLLLIAKTAVAGLTLNGSAVAGILIPLANAPAGLLDSSLPGLEHDAGNPDAHLAFGMPRSKLWAQDDCMTLVSWVLTVEAKPKG